MLAVNISNVACNTPPVWASPGGWHQHTPHDAVLLLSKWLNVSCLVLLLGAESSPLRNGIGLGDHGIVWHWKPCSHLSWLIRKLMTVAPKVCWAQESPRGMRYGEPYTVTEPINRTGGLSHFRFNGNGRILNTLIDV